VTGKIWYAAELAVNLDAREAIEYGLMEAGAVGTETREAGDSHIKVIGYFKIEPEIEKVRGVLRGACRIYNVLPQSLDLEIREVADADWLAEWKKGWQPVKVGRFIVAPPWIMSEPGAVATGPSTYSNDPLAIAGPETITIRIEPGMAFGTGTHETTRLCLKAIEKYFHGGSFLDVGTGTGILAIAAARMFPNARIEACDTDAEAVEIAKANARLNGVAEHIALYVGSVNEQTASADLVCANLTAPVIVQLLPQLLAATCGRLILSGILDSQAEMVQSRLIELGATILESEQDGEWVALVV